MKYIDKIRQEIERLENEGAINKQKASENNDIESYVAWGQQEAVMGVLIRFIDSLQQEQPEVDLEKEMYNKATSECDIIWNEMDFQLCYDNLIEAFVAGAEWAMKRKENKK